MNLPHLEPLLFAKKVIERSESSSIVLCEFPQIPTLPFFIEAAAQASASFSRDEEAKIGFLVTVKDVELLKTPEQKSYYFKLEAKSDLGTIKEFFFQAFADDGCKNLVSKGFITVVIQN